jgi:hypothetical protein
MPKGMTAPAAINKVQILSFDDFNWDLFNSQPDFIKDKIKSSEEFKKLQQPVNQSEAVPAEEEFADDLPF